MTGLANGRRERTKAANRAAILAAARDLFARGPGAREGAADFVSGVFVAAFERLP